MMRRSGGLSPKTRHGFNNPMKFVDPRGYWNIPVVGGWQLFSASLKMTSTLNPELQVKDTPKPQTIKLEKKTRTIKMYINGVYKGAKYDDTCISGIDLDFKELP